MRQYLDVEPEDSRPPPITFVTVRFAGEFEHNLGRSLVALDRRHQLVVVDNSHGLRFRSLGEAFAHGIERAKHDLVALVHEDVLLTTGFGGRLARSLRRLDETDPEWGLAGAVGGGIASVDRLDEQLVLFRRSSGLRPDPRLPSIHGLRWDLALQARARGRATHAIDVIERAEDSPKIRHRLSNWTFEADTVVAEEYLRRKWKLDPVEGKVMRLRRYRTLEEPIVLLGRGGGGTRLLSVLADEFGIFVGGKRNQSGDSLEMVPAVYRALLRAAHADGGAVELSPQDLAAAANDMLELAAPPGLWGFKVPESMLVVEAIMRAFPNARYLHLVRDPTRLCLRRPHMTARPDNEVGRACLRSAYRHAGLDATKAGVDPPCVRMAYTTVHQVGAVMDLRDTGRLDGRYLELRFEDVVARPGRVVERVAQWLGASVERPGALAAVVDQRRAAAQATDVTPADVRRVQRIVEPLRIRLGYRGLK
jgi:sulfotransferase family protein